MTTFNDEYTSSMDSKYYFKTRLGAPTSIQSPNQLGEASSRLNEGIKQVEVGALSQNILDQVPKTHFDEIRRLNKLTGAEASFHAPIQDLDIAGFVPGQNVWSADQQKENIEKIKGFIDKVNTLGRSEEDIKKGRGQENIPIVLHGGTLPAQKYQKTGLAEGGKYFEDEELEKAKLQDQRSEILIVNQETGQLQGVKYEEMKRLDGTTEVWTPERRLKNLNRTEWDHQSLEIMQMQKSLNEVKDRYASQEEEYKVLKYGEAHKSLTKEQEKRKEEVEKQMHQVANFEKEINQNVNSVAFNMNNRFLKFADKNSTEYKDYMEKIEPRINNLKQEAREIYKKEKTFEELDKKIKEFKDYKEVPESLKEEWRRRYEEVIGLQDKQGRDILELTSQMPAPKTWLPVEEFSEQKSAETLSESALYGYEKYGEKAPILAVENVYPGMQASRAKELRKTIEKAQDEFVEKLKKQKGLSEEKARKIAEKLIGATWDVGHINQLRKYGYSEEDILKETKDIANLVKHVHLTDNFGFDDSHLPPGLGNVPMKEMLEILEKEGKFKGKSIVEAGAFVAAFKESPYPYTLEYFNKSLYTEDAKPYWKDVWDREGGYTGGFGEIMPQKYFDLYGPPGFGQLPPELGGSAKKQTDRFSGTPME